MKKESPIKLLRRAAILLKKEKLCGRDNLIIPEQDKDKYPMDIKPGYYETEEVSKAIYFLADMLE